MNDTKKVSLVQERLVGLYLRLNGYLQSGLIMHSEDWGSIDGEIDRIGIRFLNHSQPNRQVECDSKLKIGSANIDFIVCEVKNKGVEFNKSLRVSPKSDFCWHQIVSWSGLYDELESDVVIKSGPDLVNADAASIREITTESKQYGKIRLRAVMFVFDQKYVRHDLGYLLISGAELMNYIWSCFSPVVRRETCSTTYPYSSWGSEYTDIVEYLKERVKKNQGCGTVELLVNTLKN